MVFDQDDITDVRIFTPVAFPGTTLYKQGIKLGIIKDEHEYLPHLVDNEVMRYFNYKTYPDYELKLWIHILYSSYRMAYFIESREYLNRVKFFFKIPKAMLKLIYGRLLNKIKQKLHISNVMVKRNLILKPSDVLNVSEEDDEGGLRNSLPFVQPVIFRDEPKK
jgi:hypothetical protein